MASEMVTQERLKELLNYDPQTGLFNWRIRRCSHVLNGDEAGSLSRALGYIRIRVDKRLYYAHRLAWLYIHGKWPKEIDHRNGNGTDNRMENLRDGTHALNMQNQVKANGQNAHGFLGAKFDKRMAVTMRRWSARINISGKAHYLGAFVTPEEAHAAYVAAKRKLHPFGEL